MARDESCGAEVLRPDLCVIGGGSGGLSVAAGAVQMGASVVLIEGGRMGGDCLNHGCVPSKALLAAGRHAIGRGRGAAFGIAPARAEVDFAAVHGHVHGVIAGIAPHDSVERFEGLGVRVIEGHARFTGRDRVEAAGCIVMARRFVIATGSRAVVPPIPGLADVPYLTNETLFDLTERPEHLIILGGGPIGMEMAQAHRRLGAAVTVLEGAAVLGREDPEAAAVVRDSLRGEGVTLREQARVVSVAGAAGSIAVTLDGGAVVTGSHLLVAVGRRAALDSLDLASGGIAADPQGVKVDRGLRSTSNRRVYAVGDAAGGMQFTHLAGYHAGLVIRSALFRLPVRVRTDHIPRTTYTDPELAQIGLSEPEARAAGVSFEVARASFAENDRARAERRTDGFAKILVGRRGAILGATIVGPQAGELIGVLALAMAGRLRIGAVAGMVAPYPTLVEVVKRAAGAYYAPRLFANRRIGQIVRLLARLP